MIKNWLSKTMLRSRTIAAAILGILGIILTKIFGLEDVSLTSVVDLANGLQGSEVIAIVALVLTALFRKYLRVDLNQPTQPKG